MRLKPHIAKILHIVFQNLEMKEKIDHFVYSKLGFGVFLIFITSFFARFVDKKTSLESKNDDTRFLPTSDSTKEYSVTWNIDLDGKDSLLESDFLKSGLEYSAKVFINRQLRCEEDDNGYLDSTSFYSVTIENVPDQSKLKRISGNGRCRGNRTRCKKKVKKSVSDAGKFPEDSNTHQTINDTVTKNDLCDTSIFDLFKDTLITASFFNYNVTLDVINDFAGNLDLDLNVEFLESSGDGLDQIDSVSFEAEEPVEISVSCDNRCEQQRQEQRSIMTNIFQNFDISFDGSKHECLFEGVNCNEQELITHIWLSKYIHFQYAVGLLRKTNNMLTSLTSWSNKVINQTTI